MSSFLRVGRRKSEEGERRIFKQRKRAYFQLLNKLNKVAIELNANENVTYTETNINEYAKPILGRDLDSMEVFFLLTKLKNVKIEEDDKD